MPQQIHHSDTKLNIVMNTEQFNQVIEAILTGKYSWACVLLLRSIGYNPLQYIPYRTYNRLLKENCQIGSSIDLTNRVKVGDRYSEVEAHGTTSNSKERSSKINDLAYLEVVGKQHTPIKGGSLEHFLDRNRDYKPSNLESVQPRAEWFSVFK